MSQTLYEKYGGFGAVSRVVMSFYDRLLDSDDIGPFFDDVDMPRLIDHQTKFIAHLLGGPADFSADRLLAAHARLDIADGDFDAVKQMLDETLDEHGFSDDDRIVIGDVIESHRGQVVTRT